MMTVPVDDRVLAIAENGLVRLTVTVPAGYRWGAIVWG